MAPVVTQINAFEEALQDEDASVLSAKTAAWQAHLSRYSEDVELYARRKLESFDEGKLKEVLEGWSERFDKLADDFSSVRGKADSGGDKEALVSAVLDCQETFAKIREGLPETT